ncbi:MAG: hypothetical protein E6J74_00495 [Deltaproteobacteria bacterium]|nr:MAG: hypothetical protein E6J74_00495 [Deltaproteobacteria bacterium]
MRITLLSVFAASLLGCFFSALYARPDEKIVDRARKEGSLSFYTTMAATESKLALGYPGR